MVEINNLTTVQVNDNLVKKIVVLVLSNERKDNERGLSLTFIGPGRMRKLNKTYRRKNRVTDVLAFPESKVAFERFKIGDFQKMQGLGEIVICLREIQKNAKRFGVGFEEELARVVIHGVLHLLGYDHEKSERGENAMKEKENKYLNLAIKQFSG